MARRIGLMATLLLALTAGHLRCFAAADWLIDAWRVDDGLPDNIVDAIAQTPDGYLWLGTQGGLVRFDGVHFSPLDDPGFKIERVRQLYVDHGGRLWVLGESGDAASIQEGQVKSFTQADGVPPDGLQAPAEDGQGHIWFSGRADQGCFRFDGTRFINMIPTNGPAVGQFGYLAFDTDGTLYGARLGELWRLHPGEPELIPDGADPQRVPVLCQSRHGGFWLIAHNECFLTQGGKKQQIGKIPYRLPAFFEASANYEDSEGRFWFATRFRPKPITVATNGVITQQTFTTRSNLNCRVLFEDREGNRWWSTSNDGLRRFRPRQLELVTDRGNLPANIVRAVAADPEEGVWALIGRGLVRVTNDITGEAKLLTNQLPYARSLWIDRDGTIWIGQDQVGLSRISAEGFDRFGDQSTGGVPTPLFSALFRDARDNLLIGSSEGLFRVAGSGIARVREKSQLEPARLDFRAFAQDNHGRVYAGLRNAASGSATMINGPASPTTSLGMISPRFGATRRMPFGSAPPDTVSAG